MLLLLIVLAAVGSLVAVAVGVRALRSPVPLIAVYAAVVPFGSAIDLPGLPGPFGTLSSAVGAATIVIVGLHVVLSSARSPVLIRSLPAWLGFVAVATVTVSWSVAPGDTVRSLIVLVGVVAVFVVASGMSVDRDDLRTVEAGIVAGGVITGLVALFQLVTGTMHTTAGGVPRFAMIGAGEGGDPNITAAALLLPLAVGVWRARETGRRRWWFVAAGALTGSAIVLTGSRGGLLAVALVLVILAIETRSRLAVATYLGVPVVALAVVLTITPGSTRERFAEAGSSGRTDIWRIAAMQCDRYCLTGSGWGTFSAVHREGMLTQPSARGRVLDFKAHNMWVRTVIEAGVAGLILLLVAVVATFRDLFALPRRLRAPPLAGVAGVIFANSLLANLDFKYVWLAFTYAALAVIAGSSVGRVVASPLSGGEHRHSASENG